MARVLSHYFMDLMKKAPLDSALASIYRFDLFDVGGYAIGVLLVIAAALVGSWIPVTRAVKVDPSRTLHCD